MPLESAGILAFRLRNGIEVLLGHPGGPYFRRKDLGAWTIPKGLLKAGEDVQMCARREFAEETGLRIEDELIALDSVRYASGKILHCFASRLEIEDPLTIASARFSMEYPPRSGKIREFPELDRAAFFTLTAAREKIHRAQVPLLDRLAGLMEKA